MSLYCSVAEFIETAEVNSYITDVQAAVLESSWFDFEWHELQTSLELFDVTRQSDSIFPSFGFGLLPAVQA